MGSDLTWEDTSYQGNIETEPSAATCWTLEIPVLEDKALMVRVHRKHDNLNEAIWYLSCMRISFGPHQLFASDIEEAQVEALQHLHMIIGQMATSIGDVALNCKSTCQHCWHNNPGLITPCPVCGEGEEKS